MKKEILALMLSSLLISCENIVDKDNLIVDSTTQQSNNEEISSSEQLSNAAYLEALIKSPAKKENADYNYKQTENYQNSLSKLNEFASSLTNKSIGKDEDNIAISPISIYYALALAAECANNNTKKEIIDAIGVNDTINKEFCKEIYNLLNMQYYRYDDDTKESKLISLLDLTNSIWFNSDLELNDACLNELTNNYYCYPFAVDFKNENEKANQYIQDFVNDKTRGLINQNFNIPKNTILSLINTLYLKDVWNTFGEDLSLTDKEYSFKNYNNSITNTKLLSGYYNVGQVIDNGYYSTFYTTTFSDFKLKFIVPNDGYSLDDILNDSLFDEVNSITNYKGKVNNKIYETNILFPEFEASYSDDISSTLKELGIKDFFNSNCDFSNISDTRMYCDQIIHKTKLNVKKNGIEGAAVTLVMMATSSVPVKIIEKTFVVDKAFAYILTDSNDIPLFEGVVKSI